MAETSESHRRLCVSAYNNGIDLLLASRLLYEKEYFSRAYVLGIVGIEQKVRVMAETAGNIPGSQLREAQKQRWLSQLLLQE